MRQIAVLLAISLTACLTGCASNSELKTTIDSTNQKIDQLSTEVDQLKSEHQQLSNQIIRTHKSAQRANDRLDNVASGYRK